MAKLRCITVDTGERLTIRQLADRAGVGYGTMVARVRTGETRLKELLRPTRTVVTLPGGRRVRVHSRRGPTRWTVDGDVATADVGGAVVTVDAADAPMLSRFHWGLYVHGRKRYVHTYAWDEATGRRVCIRLARLLMSVVDQSPRWVLVDHANGDGLDNRRANLRVCSPAENARNRRRVAANRSGVTGVNFDGRTRSWTVSSATGDHLGIRDFREAAALHWRLAAAEQGEFARRYPVTEHTCPVCRAADAAPGDDVCTHCRAMIDVDCTPPPVNVYKQAYNARRRAGRLARGLCVTCGRRPIDAARSDCRCAECLDRRAGRLPPLDLGRRRVTLPDGREVLVSRLAGTEFTVRGEAAFTAVDAQRRIIVDAVDVEWLRGFTWRAGRRDGGVRACANAYTVDGRRTRLSLQALVCADVPAAVDGLILLINGDFLDCRRGNLAVRVPDGVVLAKGGVHVEGVTWAPRTKAWYLDGQRVGSCAEALARRGVRVDGPMALD